MFNVNKTNMVIYETIIDSHFEYYKSNRELSYNHIVKLIKSCLRDFRQEKLRVKEENNKYVIYDGNHLFTAIKSIRYIHENNKYKIKEDEIVNSILRKLDNKTIESIKNIKDIDKYKFYFEINNNLNFREVVSINNDKRGWRIYDYLYAYRIQGNKEFIKFYEFRNKFNEIKYTNIIIKLLVGIEEKHQQVYKRIKEDGIIGIKDYNKSVIHAKYLIDIIDNNFKLNNSRAMIALLNIISHENYNHEHMISNLNKTNLIIDYHIVGHYIEKLLNLYNKNTRKKIHININKRLRKRE